MQIENKRLRQLNLEKHDLIRNFESNRIEKKEFKKKLEEVEEKIKQLINFIIVNFKEKQDIKKEETKMTEEDKQEIKVKEQKVKKEKTDSYASIVAKVLSMKSIKNVNDAVEKINEIKPGMEKNRIKARISAVIAEVKKQKQTRWQKYTWNQEAFLLSEK